MKILIKLISYVVTGYYYYIASDIISIKFGYPDSHIDYMAIMCILGFLISTVIYQLHDVRKFYGWRALNIKNDLVLYTIANFIPIEFHIILLPLLERVFRLTYGRKYIKQVKLLMKYYDHLDKIKKGLDNKEYIGLYYFEIDTEFGKISYLANPTSDADYYERSLGEFFLGCMYTLLINYKNDMEITNDDIHDTAIRIYNQANDELVKHRNNVKEAQERRKTEYSKMISDNVIDELSKHISSLKSSKTFKGGIINE